MRDWLELSDLALAQKVDYTEKNGAETDPALAGFERVRAQLSMLAWNSFAEPLRCDSGPIARTGVLTLPLDEETGAALMAAFTVSPPATLKRDDFAIGYVSSRTQESCDHLNRANGYRAMTGAMTTVLDRTMERLAPRIEEAVGHPFRIVSTRAFELRPGTGIEGRHLDGWPPSLRKMFLLPQGATPELGSTWFRCRDGSELVVESPRPLLLIFENSVVWHAPRPARMLRPTIELNLVPAMRTEPQACYAGLNGFYPWFPSEASFLEGTRIAARLAADGADRRGLLGRLLGPRS